jgi:hypothetical protein
MPCLNDLYQLRLEALIEPLKSSVEAEYAITADDWDDYLEPVRSHLMLYIADDEEVCTDTADEPSLVPDIDTLFGQVDLLTLQIESPVLADRWLRLIREHDPLGAEPCLV